VPSQSSTYDPNDRLTADNYDNNGNTVAANGNSYAYDFENHLTSLNNGAVTYVYDGDGNRVAKTVGGVTTNYLVDTNNPTGYAQVVDELQNGAVVRSFTYGHDLISQRIVGGSLSFYQYDGHGSVRQLTNTTGAITDAYDYDAFGNLIYRSGATPNDYLYAGEQFDANLGFYYLRARYMNPSSGRFWTMDSFAGESTDPISLHKYLYASANPLNRLDPSGRFSIGEELATLDINSILSNLASLSLKGFIGGAVIGGLDAGLRGDDIIEGAIEGGLLGAVLGPLGKVKFLGTVLVGLGTAAGIVGTADAIEQGNYELAAFRAVLALTGAVTLVRPETPTFTVPPGEPPTGGRLGSSSTRAQLREIAAMLKDRGWEIIGGGGEEGLQEEYLPPLGGSGRKGGNYVDLTAKKNGRILRINTIDTKSDGVTPTLREGAAAALIRAKTPGDHLLLIPKAK